MILKPLGSVNFIKKGKKMQEKVGIAGIDLSKRSMAVVRLTDGGEKVQRGTFTTNRIGRERFMKWLKPEDTVYIEAGSSSFGLAKEIKNEVKAEVIVLNPGDIAMIYRSLKKTDREDALKLARLGLRIPREELPEVAIPSDEEEDCRKLISEHAFYTKERTGLINRLHSVYYQAGLTELTKKDLKTKVNRDNSCRLLSERYCGEAKRLMKRIDEIENDLEEIHNKAIEVLKSHLDITSIYMSMTGIGPIISLALFSHIGYFDRFSKAKQVSNYVGLTPRVDQSGNTEKKGRISKRGCRQIRRVIVQGAWSLVRSKKKSPLKDMFTRICVSRGKFIAITAVARAMIEILFYMVKRRQYYYGTSQTEVLKKLRFYGLLNSGQGA